MGVWRAVLLTRGASFSLKVAVRVPNMSDWKPGRKRVMQKPIKQWPTISSFQPLPPGKKFG